MADSDKTKAQLIEELTTLRRRIAELEIFKDYRKLAEEARRRALGELEYRIAERTAELVEANRHLKQEIEDRKRTEAELQRTTE
jgi:C4-dicarboxylate-specific signal transduction histidine kinase